MNITSIPTYYTVQETAEKLRISDWAVRRKIKSGELSPITKPGRNYLISEEAIEKLIAANASPPGKREVKVTYGRRRRCHGMPPKL